jgi:hypothetical protein
MQVLGMVELSYKHDTMHMPSYHAALSGKELPRDVRLHRLAAYGAEGLLAPGPGRQQQAGAGAAQSPVAAGRQGGLTPRIQAHHTVGQGGRPDPAGVLLRMRWRAGGSARSDSSHAPHGLFRGPVCLGSCC